MLCGHDYQKTVMLARMICIPTTPIKPVECEILLSNKRTVSKSEFSGMHLISNNRYGSLVSLFERKTNLFQLYYNGRKSNSH